MKTFLLILLLYAAYPAFSQDREDLFLHKLNPEKYAEAVSIKAGQLEEKIVSKSVKTLKKLQQQEQKIYSKMLHGPDSLLAKMQLASIKEKYAGLRDKVASNGLAEKAKQYMPHLDSLTTSLHFLDQNGVGVKIKDALAKTTLLQGKFDQAEAIKQFIKERKELLKQQLEKLGLLKQLKQFNKQVYYYAEQLKEYKEILKDPKKIEKKALELLSKTKLFKEFMQKNSMLASLFRMPGDGPSSMANLGGLQTRAQVNGLIQQQITAGGPNAMQQFRDNLQSAQSQLSQLKDKILKSGGGSSEDIMPEGFKPNDQKTKSFFKRLEYGTNFQTQKASSYFPVTSDIGVSLGYKINDKSIIGIGVSYKLGFGRGWNAIRFSQQGAGLRSFIDWKIPSPFGGAGGGLWVSGGYEMNYKTAFNSIAELHTLDAWQVSGLLGISKSIPVKTKFFKKTKMQLLWDFMSYEQLPRTQPIVFRVGYNF